MARLEGSYEQVSSRNGIDWRLDGIDGHLDRLNARMDKHFLWVVGLIVVSIVLPPGSRLAVR